MLIQSEFETFEDVSALDRGLLGSRLEGDRELASRVDDAQGQSAFEHIEQELAAELAAPALQQGRAVRIVAAVEVPADQVLEIGDVGHERAGDLVLRAALRQRRGEQVGDGREARGLFVPGGQLGKLGPRDRPGLVEDRQDLLAPVQECGAVEVAQGFEVAAIRGLALGDGHQQIVAQRPGAAAGSAAGPRLRATRRAGGPSPGRGGSSWCRPGSRRQRSSSARCAIDSMKIRELGLGPGRSAQLSQPVGEMVGQIEQ